MAGLAGQDCILWDHKAPGEGSRWITTASPTGGSGGGALAPTPAGSHGDISLAAGSSSAPTVQLGSLDGKQQRRGQKAAARTAGGVGNVKKLPNNNKFPSKRR